MKFYKDKNNSLYYLDKIEVYNLTAICLDFIFNINFYKNGKIHNLKNAAHINGIYKDYYLNDLYYGSEFDFTKSSWRRFVKLQAFL
jgi:hypothetical protein